MRTFLALLAAVNPAAVAVSLQRRERPLVIAGAITITLAISVALAGASDGVLAALDVGPATFRIAAGVVLGVASVRSLVTGGHDVAVSTPVSSWQRLLVPVLIPVLLTPPLAMVSVTTGTDSGAAAVALAAAVSLLLAALCATAGGRSPVWLAAARFVAALGILVALDLAVDGVKTA